MRQDHFSVDHAGGRSLDAERYDIQGEYSHTRKVWEPDAPALGERDQERERLGHQASLPPRLSALSRR